MLRVSVWRVAAGLCLGGMVARPAAAQKAEMSRNAKIAQAFDRFEQIRAGGQPRKRSSIVAGTTQGVRAAMETAAGSASPPSTSLAECTSRRAPRR